MFDFTVRTVFLPPVRVYLRWAAVLNSHNELSSGCVQRSKSHVFTWVWRNKAKFVRLSEIQIRSPNSEWIRKRSLQRDSLEELVIIKRVFSVEPRKGVYSNIKLCWNGKARNEWLRHTFLCTYNSVINRKVCSVCESASRHEMSQGQK